jgi:hypothetical protein
LFAVQPDRNRVGLLAVTSDRVPSAPLASGERIEAVVGHNVEAVLALHDLGHASSIDNVGENPKVTLG